MAKPKKTDLSELKDISIKNPEKIKVGLVVAEWNEEITSTLQQGATDTLLHYGFDKDNLKAIRVPGSYELPMGARSLLKHDKFSAIICLGCVIKGETPHNDYINQAVSTGLTQLSLTSGTPCIFGVLTPLNMDQALDRAGGKHGNKGIEAAVAAVSMIKLNQELEKKSRSIGF